MRYVKIIFLCTVILLPFLSSAQKEANIWYFGNKAGLVFENGVPKALNNSSLVTEEGCTTIADKEGNILFYSDGITVWNKNHQPMPNGKELNGNPSSTQSGVAILKPGSTDVYYLFTVDATAGAKGFCYSMIDMKLQDGLGDVTTEKNIKLESPVTEKLTAVRHRNNKDVWVIVHEWGANSFSAYLVTEQGINNSPKVSSVGTIHNGGTLNTQGYLKSNPDGTNLALALEESHALEIFDFDNATGDVSNPIKIQMATTAYTYGIEFSPNGSLLYASAAGEGKIYQYNLQKKDATSIQQSGVEIGRITEGKWIGALQLAGNGKIYFTQYQRPYLGMIEFPNKIGKECGYKNDAVNLDKGLAQLGLPTFVQSYFNKVQIDTTQKITYFDNKKIEKNKNFVLKHVLFEFNKYDLQPVSFVELDKLVALLKENKTWKIKISGHTDNVGNKSSNLVLSENRAAAVKNYLINKGIEKERILSEGFGSSEPVADNATDQGRAENRRVSFRIE